MSEDRQSQLFSLFAEACELDQQARTEFMAGLHDSDPGMARELQALLAADADGSSYALEEGLPETLLSDALGAVKGKAELEAELEQLSGWTLPDGRFELRDEIGHGAMGLVRLVWDAALQREVARKTIRSRGTGSTRTLRFVSEARVTGRLEHPGIVPVHDLGVDASGEVFFTMQRVQGRNLQEIYALTWQEQEGWGRTRALGVLLRVCEAMAYAHAQGVVHRDLKPANIMVGAFGEVYVMDWGLARVEGEQHPLDSEAEGSSTGRMTMAGAVIGTPSFMSPEQASGDLEQVDERSDVYALGAMLYELLAEESPYAEGAESPESIVGRVVAREPKSLNLESGIAPELVSICSKAMARQREDRYPTMQALADDLRAFLEERVVQAHRTGAIVELQKWVRRNRLAAAGLFIAFVALVGGAITIAVIENANAERERELLADARQQEAAAVAAAGFMENLFGSQNPYVSRGEDAQVIDLLNAGADRIATDLAEYADARARLQTTLAGSYMWMGQFERAIGLFEAAVASLDDVEDREAAEEDAIDLLFSMAKIHTRSRQLERAEECLVQALQRAIEFSGEQSSLTVSAMNNLGNLRFMQGRLDEAEPVLRMAMELAPEAHGDNLHEIVASSINLGQVLQAKGQSDEAVLIIRSACDDLRAKYGPRNPTTMRASMVLLEALYADQRFDEAAEFVDQLTSDAPAVLGESSWETLRIRQFQILVRWKIADPLDEILPMQRELLRVQGETFGEDSAAAFQAETNLGQILREAGMLAEAQELYEGLESRSVVGSEQAFLAPWYLINVLLESGEEEAARVAAQRAREAGEAFLARTQSQVHVAGTLQRLAEAHADVGLADDAKAFADRLLALFPEGSAQRAAREEWRDGLGR